MVSVIITTYNYARYVERAIRSCLDQSLAKKDFEIVVVNDCSTDYTADVLENYEDVARIYNLSENVGLAAARNFGIKKAKGQYIVFLDADDYIQRDLLLVQKLFLDQNSKFDAVAIDYHLVDERGNHIEHVSSEAQPIACGIMFRKDLIYEIGLYDEKFRAREEEDLRIRFLKNYAIHHIPLPLYRYRMHDSNLTKNQEEMEKHTLLLEEKHNVTQ
ncbi:MAG: glycosyltransferase family 2 protein [Bacteroidia bacterium]